MTGAKKNVAEMTAGEAMDELTFAEFEKLLKKAKRAAEKSEQTERAVFDALDDMCIDPSIIPSAAENAETLEEAIACYISYGEYSVAGIMREVRQAYGKGE